MSRKILVWGSVAILALLWIAGLVVYETTPVPPPYKIDSSRVMVHPMPDSYSVLGQKGPSDDGCEAFTLATLSKFREHGYNIKGSVSGSTAEFLGDEIDRRFVDAFVTDDDVVGIAHHQGCTALEFYSSHGIWEYDITGPSPVRTK